MLFFFTLVVEREEKDAEEGFCKRREEIYILRKIRNGFRMEGGEG